MSTESKFCRCCRGTVQSTGFVVLCDSCRPWNDASELLRLSTPAWQQHMQSKLTAMVDEAGEWLDSSGMLRILLPSDEAWAALLREVSGRNQIRCPPDPLEGHIEEEVIRDIRDRLSSRNSVLFPSEHAIVESEDEVEATFCGHQLKTQSTSLVVDGVRIDSGPGLLLFRMMTERNNEHAAHRFLKVLRQIEGTSASEAGQLHQRRRAMLRDGRFQTVGAADAPRFDSRSKHAMPPPLCDWDCERFLLGIEGNDGGRRVMPLPLHPNLLKQFLTIWSGRPNMRVSDRLRALCLQWTKTHGVEAQTVRITPHERAFGLLRSVVDGAENSVSCTRTGMRITGSLGVAWWVAPGRGVHHTPYTIRPTMLGGRILGNTICMYDGGEELPLGDRLVAVVLGLLNDDVLSQQFGQIEAAVKQVRRLERKWQGAVVRG